ncbi:hypothetical protein F441_09042 [Phytophthora nicotianae CJ01A1]|uniref:Uncharacterized protein n=5 Tax=Phytophthora nicotianae TaxID=4792 RepID=W2Q7H2_PHYN3|nr:hypothetical protein PPTG_22974 [Phytophthora nicotianae INRA-310]ETI46523.1 hypothetical protein F443_09079 [Phytophthora nicotianae P1569]ETO75220.1 hypothetical protein F444_09133 [Phytophthora nicotianae P1976]ETP16315.1 hypothetical protein F441_09042 [Phytophthora nicotianae CJ01A1]ETP44369.1 hypothetical protein F442_09011 [Phytophthora nicotianae P10297]ETN08781.1 hypothetical protein PPTG_22974 [Phytophthora nicotianae INRA-310]
MVSIALLGVHKKLPLALASSHFGVGITSVSIVAVSCDVVAAKTLAIQGKDPRSSSIRLVTAKLPTIGRSGVSTVLEVD